ncbi:MAG: hypothetical protein AAB367_01210 [Patescibacteria group bacterium]
MLSGKRQHWVGLSKKSRKAFEHFPFKDFAILVLLAVIITMVWTWYSTSKPAITLEQVEDEKTMQQLLELRALRTARPDLATDREVELQREQLVEMHEDLLTRTKAPEAKSLSDKEILDQRAKLLRQDSP